MVTLARNVLAVAAWGFVAALLIQVFLAGLGVFRSAGDFDTHRNFGYLLGLMSLLLLVLAIAVRARRRQVVLAAIVLGLVILQSVFIAVRASSPEFAAFHLVNGFVILLAAIVFAWNTWRLGGFTEL
jgi:hypothetical protein